MSDKKLDEKLAALIAQMESGAEQLDQTNVFDQGIQNAIPETLNNSFTAADSIEIGAQFNAYKITELIAEGGMGKVFLAKRTDGQYEDQVALKLLSTPFPDTNSQQRFFRESQILADLKHPYIVTIIDAGIDELQRPWFVIDYIDGESITTYAANKKLTLQENVSLIKDIAQAIDFAHSKGIIHRDIKPANILVTNTANRVIPKVLDFGIAFRKTDHKLTQAGHMIGTPGYMAPEQINEGIVDERTDIFSLGIVIYELFTQTKPFHANSIIEIQNKILNTEPPSIQKQLKNFPTNLQLIVEKCLNKNPQERYQSISQLSNDLTSWQKGYPISVTKASLISSFKAAILRNRLISAVLFFTTLLIITSSLFYTYRINQERNEAIQAKNESEELLSFMLKDLYTQLQEVGRTDILKNVASKSLSQLDKYQFSNNQSFQIKKAMGYMNIADVLENEKAIDEAESAITKSIKITSSLLDSSPHNQEALALNVKATASLASIYHLQGELKKSETMLNNLASQLPKPASMSRALLAAYWEFSHSKSWNQMEQGNHSAAQKLLDDMMAIIDIGENKFTEDKQWLIKRYRTLQTQGWNRLELKQYQQSINDIQSAIQWIQILLKNQPNHAQYKLHEQLILNQLSYVYLLDEQPQEAQKVIIKAIELGNKLRIRLPENKRILRELSYSWSTLGDLQLAQQHLSEAINSFTESLNISKNLAQHEPNNQSAQNDLAVDSMGLAKIWLNSGDTEKAKALFLQAENAIADIAKMPNASIYYVHTYAWILMYLEKPETAKPYIEQLKNSQGWGNKNYLEILKTFPALKEA